MCCMSIQNLAFIRNLVNLFAIDNFNNLFSLGGRDAKDTQSFSARAQETGLRESGPDVPSWAKGVRARVDLLDPPTAHLAT